MGNTQTNSNEIQQVEKYPEYPERGVRYAKYSRKSISNGEYVPVVQATRFIQATINDGIAGNHPFARPEYLTKRFFCTYCFVEIFRGVVALPSNIYVQDVNGASAAVKIPIKEHLANTSYKFALDFQSCPREFAGNAISIYVETAFAGAYECTITLYGFDEDR